MSRPAGLRADIRLQRGSLRLAVSLAVEPGEVVALVGPNGAGKTTTLRALAGLLRPGAGTVRLGDRILDGPDVHVPVERRPVAVVFQDYLLFPHLTVLDNVAFGLRTAGRARSAARQQAADWLQRFGIADLAASRPGALSGGQAQRVALARALATGPDLLLLDEPMAALDARSRLTVRGELRRHLAGFTGAAVVITHDPTDAVVLADRLVVVEDGVVVQSGTPAEVTRRPRTDYVARLVGLNLWHGRGEHSRVRLAGGNLVVTTTAAEGEVFAAFRPAAVALWPRRPEGSPRNLWAGAVRGLEPVGDSVRVDLDTAAGRLAAEVTAGAVADLGLDIGTSVWASVKASEVEVYPAD